MSKLCQKYSLDAWFSFGSQREDTLLDFPVDGACGELEVVHLFWTDVSFGLQTVRVTAKPELGFYPKRWEEREVPIPVQLIERLKAHTRRSGCNFVFSRQKGIGITICSTTQR